MLFKNLQNKEQRQYFENILSENLNSKINCKTLSIGDEVRSYVFLFNNSTLLSVTKDKEELFTPNVPDHATKISLSIDSFNKLCSRNEKIDYICS